MKEKRFGKKHVVLAVMVLALGAAVYLNYYVAGKTPSLRAATDETSTSSTQQLGESVFVNNTTAVVEENSYFETARQNREAARQEALDILQDTLQGVKIEDSVKQEAVMAAASVAAAVEQEDAIENLLRAKGFEDCVVYIENGNCHVAVKAAELTQAQSLQILQIVTAQSTVEAQNVNILAVDP